MVGYLLFIPAPMYTQQTRQHQPAVVVVFFALGNV